ncbi:hypothetical protein LCGC14_1430530 [marine sediment metagenome]|uniref:Uncharacterized protein n=1 Tax=marine sediment metagenome TaxID=412755 RepID=A0A0F9JNQ9_9ZZZZ
MTISKDNFIVVYRLGDTDSKEWAEYYAGKHNMSISNIGGSEKGKRWQVDGQLVGVGCSDEEILDSDGDFNKEVLFPIQGALEGNILTGNPSQESFTIWGIILGYNVPGGYYYREDPSQGEYRIISSTSRVARGCSKTDGSYNEFSLQVKNKLYDRSIYSRYGADDIQHSLIVSRIDAPTLLLAKQYVDQAEALNKKRIANGLFYIDPYSDKVGAEADDYRDLLLDFKNNLLPTLNLDSWSTTFLDPYIDVAIPFAREDSFMWSWFTNRAHSTFFQTNTASRAFFYNADYDGAETIRNINGNTWPILAMNGGYAACAGAMDDPTISGFLNPNAFFKSLFRGSTMGEAYLFSLPYLDWTMTLFGDPLSYVFFPGELVVDDDSIEENESWYLMSRELAKVSAYYYKQEQETIDIRNLVVDRTSSDIDAEQLIPLLNSSQKLYLSTSKDIRRSKSITSVRQLFAYPVQRYRYWGESQTFPPIDLYLTNQNFKVSRLLIDVVKNIDISEDNLLNEGWWEFEFELRDEVVDFVNYYFLLEVYNNPIMSHEYLEFTRNSYDIDNWLYEKEKDIFVPIPQIGVSSSYIGRKIRYQSREDTALIKYNEYLDRGETYYFRIIQYTRVPEMAYDYRNFEQIIYT